MIGAPRDLLLALMTTTDLPTMKKLVLATGDEKLSQALEMLEALKRLKKAAEPISTIVFFNIRASKVIKVSPKIS